METRPNIRRLVLITAGGLVIIMTLVWLWHYLHSGKIIITTNNAYGSIVLTKVNNAGNHGNTPQSFKGSGRLNVNVSTGEYFATVKYNSRATVQLINLSSHKTLKYEIDPVKTVGVAPVAYEQAANIVATSNKLLYLDKLSDHLTEIDSSNKLSAPSPAQTLQSVRWANSSFGVGQDSNGRLYVINDGKTTLLNVPFTYNSPTNAGSTAISFDVAPDKQIFISNGRDVYAGGQSGKFKQIYKPSASSLALAAGADYVAIAGKSIDVGDTAQKSELVILSASKYSQVAKESITNIGSGETDAFAWSPDNQFLVSPGKYNALVYDNSLHIISKLPVNPGAVVWLDSNTFFYSYNDQLWRYSLSNQTSDLLANMPLGSLVSGLTISNDKSYIYLATINSGIGSKSAIRRVGLKSQPISKVVYNLQDILPLSLGQCNLSLINFVKPAVLVQSNASQSQLCLSKARATLKSRGFEINSLQFVSSH